MRENFEFALKASSGEYVIFFGDDDGIIPNQFNCLRNILLKYKPDALSWDFLTYVWPIKGYGKRTGGLRFVKKKTFGNVTQVNNKESKETLLNADFANESILPRIYHGCMSRHFLDTLISTKIDAITLQIREKEFYNNEKFKGTDLPIEYYV